MPNKPDPKIWRRRATAFAVRTHNHLWGKNNEDPLVFLYRKGFTHAFSKQIYLGWNKFGQERPYEGWGIEKKGSFFIPPGIVFPHIIEKIIESVFIIPMTESSPLFLVPGSKGYPVILAGAGEKEISTSNLLYGLLQFQDNPDAQRIKIISP